MAGHLLYIEEVAEMIQCSPSAVRYMVPSRTAPRSAKLGGRHMFRESDVTAWIDAAFNSDAD